MPWPERWVIGPIGAACVDAQDHVLLLNRQEVLDVDLDAGTKAPPVIELDPAGRVVNSWGEGVFKEPVVNTFHNCRFDADNNVWIVANDSGAVQKFSHDGSKLLLQIGKSDVFDSSDGTRKGKELNSDAALFFVPADIAIDKNGDVYVDDGDGPGNHRIVVTDRTGKFLRQWAPPGVRSIHCMALADDGLVYVCDRDGNRLQVFDKMGNFKKNFDVPYKVYTPVAPGDTTKRRKGTPGSAVSIALSRDPNQQFIYVINQNNSQIDIMDRQSGKVVSSFGRSGHLPGQFDQPLNIAVDSKNNVYVTENRGKRVQKFTPVESLTPRPR